MTISGTTNRVNQDGNGVTTDIPIPSTMPFQAQSDLVVIETVIATGVQTTKVLTTDYTITGSVDGLGYYSSGGTVVANTAFPSTVRWTVYRDPARTQALDLTENNSLPAESLEASLDRLTMLVQRVADQIGRSVRQPEGDEADIAQIPSRVDRASKYHAYDADGDPVATSGTTSDVVVTTFVETILDDTTAAAVLATLGISSFGPFDWTPALTFDTPGDLAVTYTVREGKGVRIGPLVFLSANILTASFTYTTATGRFMITGSPYAAGVALQETVGPAAVTGDASATNIGGYTCELDANNVLYLNANVEGTFSQTNQANFLTAATVGVRLSIVFFAD